MPDPTRPSPTAAGVLRRRSARLVELGLLVAVIPDSDRPRFYTVTTTGGDVVDVARRDMPAYLSGIAHGAQAAGSPAHQALTR